MANGLGALADICSVLLVELLLAAFSSSAMDSEATCSHGIATTQAWVADPVALESCPTGNSQ